LNDVLGDSWRGVTREACHGSGTSGPWTAVGGHRR
jgi:hypothetical protein